MSNFKVIQVGQVFMKYKYTVNIGDQFYMQIPSKHSLWHKIQGIYHHYNNIHTSNLHVLVQIFWHSL